MEHRYQRFSEKSSYSFGPFTYINIIFGREELKHLRTKQLDDLRKVMGYRDSSFRRLYHRVMTHDKYLSMTWVPASFSLERPGPNEDPLLKEPFSKISNEDKKYGKFPFCFESIESLKKWFSDPVENRHLHRNGFVISEYMVQSNKLITGYHQSIFEDCPEVKKIGSISIF